MTDRLWQSSPFEFSLPLEVVHVWRLALNDNACRMHRSMALLSDDERRRAERFHFLADQDRFATSRSVLRILLGCYTGCDPREISFGYTPHGKPFLSMKGSEISPKFNLSHSAGYALFAFSRDRDVGIDVEHIRPLMDLDMIAAQVFNRQERGLIARAADSEQAAFFRLWSRKEAYVKAVGHGLSGSLQDVSVVTSSIDAPDTSDPAGDSRRWCVQDIACAPEYSAALASEGQPTEVCFWGWKDPAGGAFYTENLKLLGITASGVVGESAEDRT